MRIAPLMPEHFIPYGRQWIDDDDVAAVAEAFCDGAITIPLHPTMTDEDCARVIDAVQDTVS